jgi:hypothetical protein
MALVKSGPSFYGIAKAYLLIIFQKVQVSDTTSDAICTTVYAQKLQLILLIKKQQKVAAIKLFRE